MSSFITIITSFAVGVTTAIIFKNSFGSIFALGSRMKSSIPLDKTKLALIIRTDLKMGKGKCCAQCAHAAVSCYKKALRKNEKAVEKWENEGQPKIVLKPDTSGEDVMYELMRIAENNRLVTCVIRDAGRTQIQRGSVTVVGIGPGSASKIDKIVGHLKLF